MRWSRFAVIGIVASLMAASCQSAGNQTGGGASTACTKSNYVPYVFHVPPSIPFISVFQKGVAAAAKDYAGPPYCITTRFLAPDKFDTAQMASILSAALAQNPAGLAVSYPDPSALGPGLKRALGMGIPVVTVNAGETEALALGVLAHVGEDEAVSGLEHGRRDAAAGEKNVMCVNDNPGTNILHVRCQGIERGLAQKGGKSFEFPASNADPVAMGNAIVARLRSDPTIDGIDGVFSGDYQVALKAISDAGMKGKVKVEVFDYEPGTAVLTDIKNGNLVYASSQSPFLQGYVPIQLIALQLAYGQIPNEHELINTGGVFVDSSNVDFYLKLASTA